MDNEVKRVFTPKPMISFHGARKMRSYLVSTKLYPEERTKGSFKCSSKHCEVCLNVNKTSTFTSTVILLKLILLSTNLIAMTTA